MLFRVITHLSEIGYPPHWLSTALGNIMSNNIVTRAHAPRSYPLGREEVSKEYPSRKINVAPFVAEMSILATVWERFMSFGMMLDLPSKIHHYRIFFVRTTFRINPNGHVPVLVLAFFDQRYSREPPGNLRKLLLDDELGDKSSNVKRIREVGAIVVTTLTWNIEHARWSSGCGRCD